MWDYVTLQIVDARLPGRRDQKTRTIWLLSYNNIARASTL